MPGPSPDAASTMPSDSPNFILRGARFGDHRRKAPDEVLRLVRRFDARENRAMTALADVERQAEKFVGALDVLRVDDFRDAKVDFGEVIDGDVRAR